MEPQPFSCGNPIGLATIMSVSLELQWSHNLSVVETFLITHGVQVDIWLQWSHNLSVVETNGAKDRHKRNARSFNGATTFQLWKQVQGDLIEFEIG